MIRMQIQVTQDQARALKRLAAERGTSQAALAREGIEQVLRLNAPSSEAALRERARAVAGIGASGLDDISERHDDYLAEAYAE